MAGKKSILSDKRYPDFVARYCADPLAFVVEVCGLTPSADQVELCEAVAPLTSRVSVVSGTTTGKSSLVGRLCLWHLLCFPVAVYEDKVEIGSNTYIGAAALAQVADSIWKELNDSDLAIASGEFAWVRDYYTITKTRVEVKGYESQWFIGQVAMAKGQSVAIAGKHRFHQWVVVDEAAGVPDEHFNVIEGTQSQGGNRILMLSQGARNSGRFYDSHHGLRREAGGAWHCLRFSSENSPFVEDGWLASQAFKSGGRNSAEYKIRCRGLFAENSSNILLTRAELDKAFKVGQIIQDDEAFGWVILGDVGMGEYRDDSVMIVARVIGNGDGTLENGDADPDARRVEYMAIPICHNDKNEVDMAGDLVNAAGDYSNSTLFVDNGGIGHAVNTLIERQGGVVNRIDWGQPCFKAEFKKRFYNKRACAQVRFRDAIRQGRVSFRFPAGLDQTIITKITEQGARLPYRFSEAGGLRYVMMSKEDMLKEGYKSPDVIDAMSFAFLEDCHYSVADRSKLSARNEKIGAVADDMARDLAAELGGA